MKWFWRAIFPDAIFIYKNFAIVAKIGKDEQAWNLSK